MNLSQCTTNKNARNYVAAIVAIAQIEIALLVIMVAVMMEMIDLRIVML